MFDPDRKRAMVSVRCPSWRSYELGFKVTEFCVFANIFVSIVIAWKLIPEFESFLLRLIAVVLTWSILASLITRWLRYAMPGVLARQFFAERISLWFTANAIAFRSSLYRSGVILNRSWRSVPIELRFSLDEDPVSQLQIVDAKPERKLPKFHFQDARRLNVIVRQGGEAKAVPQPDGIVIRSIPVCELMSAQAKQMVVVCNAAHMLTEMNTGHGARRAPAGVDIDAN
ncbi:hypothetical protein [Planctomycetes bacterium TBK1r]